MSDRDNFDQPHEVSDMQLAFPAGVMDLMPKYEDIPEAFRRGRDEGKPWVDFQSRWFFYGFPKAGLIRREGVDAEAAFRHLSVIQGSFDPKHEHKMAAVAWLASRWFSGIASEGGAK